MRERALLLLLAGRRLYPRVPRTRALRAHRCARSRSWIVSRRARDLGVLTMGGVLDVVQLAHAMHLRDKMRATCVLEVTHADSAVTARLYDSVVLHHSGPRGSGEPSSSRLVSDLRQSELVAGPLISLIEGLRTAPGGRGLALGMSRYLWHVPTLKGEQLSSPQELPVDSEQLLSQVSSFGERVGPRVTRYCRVPSARRAAGQLTSLSVFRPRLSLSRHLLHVNLDVADLLVHDKSRALAVEGSVAPGMLSTPASLEALLPLLQAQDHDPAFRDLVLKLVPQQHGLVSPEVRCGGRRATW